MTVQSKQAIVDQLQQAASKVRTVRKRLEQQRDALRGGNETDVIRQQGEIINRRS